MAAVLLSIGGMLIQPNSPLWNWINVGLNAILTLNMDSADDRAVFQQWQTATNTIIARGPDAVPTDDEWNAVLQFDAFEHARAQASPV